MLILLRYINVEKRREDMGPTGDVYKLFIVQNNKHKYFKINDINEEYYMYKNILILKYNSSKFVSLLKKEKIQNFLQNYSARFWILDVHGFEQIIKEALRQSNIESMSITVKNDDHEYEGVINDDLEDLINGDLEGVSEGLFMENDSLLDEQIAVKTLFIRGEGFEFNVNWRGIISVQYWDKSNLQSILKLLNGALNE